MSAKTPLAEPILKFISLCSDWLITLGALLTVAYDGSDDGIIEGMTKLPDDAPLEEAIETNRDDIKTVTKNQQRIYAMQQAQYTSLKSLFFKGIGLLATLLTAIIGLVGAVIVI